MKNRSGIDIPIKDLASDNPGYIQAVDNVAYAVHDHVDQMVEDVIGGNSNRMVEFLENTYKTEEELEANRDHEDLKTYFAISEEIIPTISQVYGIDEVRVTDDVGLIIDLYTQKIIEDTIKRLS